MTKSRTFGQRFGDLVKSEREKRQWSLAELAYRAWSNGDEDFIGQDRAAQVNRIEAGTAANPQARTVEAIRKALELDPNQIDALRGTTGMPDAELVAALLERNRALGSELKLKDKLVVKLAEQYAEGAANDFDGAVADLRAALEAAADLKRRAEMPSNLDGQVKATLAEVARLNDEARLDEGKAVIDRDLALLADRVAETNAARGQLLDGAIEQARAMNDPAAAAGYTLARLQLDAPPDLFEALRGEQDRWYVNGRDRGLNFDLRVSITLANMACDRADTADRRGTAHNNLGNALQALGEREAGTGRLQQAVEACRAALEEWIRERVPLDWAMTQNNLGNALATLGKREAGTGRLQQAVEAYRAALEEWTRERVPLNWALTQNNLGNALLILGERETGTEQLQQAVEAYRAALEERTRDRAPLQWAGTQTNLGNALLILGKREAGNARLEQAIAAYRAAREELTRERVPLVWAKTQNNLGEALRALGKREVGTARLEQAVAAYRAAQEEQTRDRVPLDWAMTQNNLGNVLRTLGELEAGTGRLQQAVEAYRAALEERTRERVPLDWAGTQFNLGLLALAFHTKTGNPARLDDADRHLAAAREVFTEAESSHYLAQCDKLQANITAARTPTP